MKYLRHDSRFAGPDANTLQSVDYQAVLPPPIEKSTHLAFIPHDHQEFLLNTKIFLLILLHRYVLKLYLKMKHFTV